MLLWSLANHGFTYENLTVYQALSYEKIVIMTQYQESDDGESFFCIHLRSQTIIYNFNYQSSNLNKKNKFWAFSKKHQNSYINYTRLDA